MFNGNQAEEARRKQKLTLLAIAVAKGGFQTCHVTRMGPRRTA
jgi:hypothetical protein